MGHFEFIITRTFDAPRELVWQVWTDEGQLKDWFGPVAFPIHSCTLDLAVGGSLLYGMRGQDGTEIWGKWIFREIDEPDRLVFIVHFSNAEGETTRNPFVEGWPLHILSTVTFEETDGRTEVTVKWEAYDSTDAERATFEEGQASMREGWTGTLDKLEDHLRDANGN